MFTVGWLLLIMQQKKIGIDIVYRVIKNIANLKCVFPGIIIILWKYDVQWDIIWIFSYIINIMLDRSKRVFSEQFYCHYVSSNIWLTLNTFNNVCVKNALLTCHLTCVFIVNVIYWMSMIIYNSKITLAFGHTPHISLIIATFHYTQSLRSTFNIRSIRL